MRKALSITAAAIACVAVAVLYYYFNPSSGSWLLKCPFRLVTGLQCPACGNQRALHSLLHLDIVQAWRYNPFLLISLPYIVPLTLSWFFRRHVGKIWSALSNRYVVYTYVVLLSLWWILRNIFPLSL